MNTIFIGVVVFLFCQQERLASAVLERPGSCPMFPLFVHECPEDVKDLCSTDIDCKEGFKCCRMPCLKTCFNVTGSLGPAVDVCSLPKVVGPCKAAFQRWFFDKNTKKCEKFIYGGCGKNENNFETLEECQKACPVDVCNLPKVVGPCKAAFQRWHFNQKTKSCERFIYGGCRGNENNFETLEECQIACPVSLCTLPPKTGPCEALIQRYYFNAKTRSCQMFTYGGCEGNANNFETFEDCQMRCGVGY